MSANHITIAGMALRKRLNPSFSRWQEKKLIVKSFIESLCNVGSGIVLQSRRYRKHSVIDAHYSLMQLKTSSCIITQTL